MSVVRNPEANIFLPNEDEWYKAAYYDAVSGSFFDYPTSSNAAVSCEAPGPSAGAGNCLSPGLVDVGSNPNSASPYGTFDQGGNSFEWVHKNPSTGSIQGGSFIQAGNYWPLVSSSFTIGSRLGQDNFIGFRLSSAAVPEPSTGLLLLVGLAGLSKWRRSVV